ELRANRAPVLDKAIPDHTFSGPGVQSYTVPANTFLELENNPLTYSATLTSGAALPAWLTFDPATRTFSGNPSPSAALQLRVIANDGNGASGFDDFQLTLVNVNDTPTDLALSSTNIAENQPTGTIVGTLTTTDGDSADTFTYVLVPGTGSADNASFTISGNT